MFARTLLVTFSKEASTAAAAVPLAWLDSFAMRNFTNSAQFDDLLPVEAGRLEAGFRVPLPALALAMEAWFRRKGWLSPQAVLHLAEQARPDSAVPHHDAS